MPSIKLYGVDDAISELSDYAKKASTVGEVVEAGANEIKDESIKIAESKGLKVTGAGVSGIVTERNNFKTSVGWSERPNLHLYFHEIGFHAGFEKGVRESRGKRKRRYKTRKYIAPKPHIRPAAEKLEGKIVKKIEKHILD